MGPEQTLAEARKALTGIGVDPYHLCCGKGDFKSS